MILFNAGDVKLVIHLQGEGHQEEPSPRPAVLPESQTLD